MTKFLVLALAVVFSLNSHAAAEKDGKKDDVVARQHMMEAMKAVGKEAKANPAVEAQAHTLQSSGLMDHLDPSQAQALGKGLHNSRIADAVKKAQGIAAKNPELANTLITGIANVAKLGDQYLDMTKSFGLPMDQAKQGYVALILGAGEQAIGTDATAKNFEAIARAANAEASQGRYDVAMEGALKKLRELTKNEKLTMEDLKKLCPPKV